jgi:hypothetical protein
LSLPTKLLSGSSSPLRRRLSASASEGKADSSSIGGRRRFLTPMYGPAARCKRVSSTCQMRSCINVSGLRLERVVLRAIMDISAHATLLADKLSQTSAGGLREPCGHVLLERIIEGLDR